MLPDGTPRERLQRLWGYLAQDPGNPALLADTCAAALAAGDLQCAAALVESGAASGAGTLDAMQTMLLRALHRAGRVGEAATWAEAQREAGSLQPGAAGIASLVAIDRDDFAAAKALADASLAVPDPPPEALVARLRRDRGTGCGLRHRPAAARVAGNPR